MPASYAHFRFGQQLLPKLSQRSQDAVRRFPNLYAVGLHGPDLFFYYNPISRTPMGALGGQFHKQEGRVLFASAAKLLKDAPDEGTASYLWGLLAHYALDRACHPFINAAARERGLGHIGIETEFERYLLTRDGVKVPWLYDCSRHMRLTVKEAATAARFYAPATPRAIRQSVRNMRLLNRVLAAKNRALVESIFRMGGASASQLVMAKQPDSRCLPLQEPLMELYHQALRSYPLLQQQLEEHIHSGAPLDGLFATTFE